MAAWVVRVRRLGGAILAVPVTGENAFVHYPLTAHRRDTVLALLRPLHGESASLVAEVSLGHDWAPVTRFDVRPRPTRHRFLMAAPSLHETKKDVDARHKAGA